jgi:hypothetical protein
VPVTDFHCPSFSITLRQSDDAGRQIKVRRFGHSQVDDKFERGRSLNRYFGNRRAAQILIICRLTCVRQMPTMLDGSDIVIGPMISRPSYDASMLIPYFDVATSGPKQYRSIRVDVENDNDRALLIAALLAMQPPLTIHIVDDELEMLRRCETLWPGELVTGIR